MGWPGYFRNSCSIWGRPQARIDAVLLGRLRPIHRAVQRQHKQGSLCAETVQLITTALAAKVSVC